MRGIILILAVVFIALIPRGGYGAEVSDDTETCLECHSVLTPGIVEAWKRSRHAAVSPGEGLQKKKLERRISTEEIPERLLSVAVGCAECHTLNPEAHGDTFEHNDYQVHIVVSPADCALCHVKEERQFAQNIMSTAHGNLVDNPLYMDLVKQINGVQVFDGNEVDVRPPVPETNADSCLYCHGTVVKVTGMMKRETDLADVEIPVLSGWPNQGVGRINPDGTRGSCSSCHTRHEFSIKMARSPQTCSECHKGPDVPAYPVYQVSKHGNIYGATGSGWNFDSVPWRPGKDFLAPTCATCHVSLLVDGEGEVISERSHRMNDRLPWRLFGVVYAHAHPKSPDISIIRNRSGMPLATELTGEPATEYLIGPGEQERRLDTMKSVCLSCHGTGWVQGHFNRLDNTILTTNDMTLTATRLLVEAWRRGAAKGMDRGDSIFNEAIERKWVRQWLFYANSVRLASAMAGADYGTFANGRWYMAENIREMADWLEFKGKEKE
ncbi:MAG: hydroxylamine oxidase [Deltaproteobacteria bacterium]|nr:hydroxylamine oxidase [Deltaproteobacteria bacterium]